MGLFSGLTSSGEPAVPMDDNAAIADASSNPYLSTVVPQVQAAYDTMYDAVKYVLIGKDASLKQIDRWIGKWEERLERIVEKYKEILKAFDDQDAAFQGMFDFQVLQQAWDTLQDFPILRRYMGEANYWALYDTLGLLATQAGSISADLSTALKEAIKAAIRALLAMTDGLMSLESYLGMITQYWGALYTKTIPLAMLDSIVPNVTCAYHYKKVQTSQINGVTVNNPVPGPAGFVPVPVPIPDPVYAATHFGSDLIPDLGDPTTWVDENGNPKFLNISTLQDALAYWGSSYFNESLPPATATTGGLAFYTRRPYLDAEGDEVAHPLQVGKTFAQLDTSLSKMAAGQAGASAAIDPLPGKLGGRYEEFLNALHEWQEAFEQSRAAVKRVLATMPTLVPISTAQRSGIFWVNSGQGVTDMAMLDPNTSEYLGSKALELHDAYLDAMFGTHDEEEVFKSRPKAAMLTAQVRGATERLFKIYAEATGQGTDDPNRLFAIGRELAKELNLATAQRMKGYTAIGSTLGTDKALAPAPGRTTITKTSLSATGALVPYRPYAESANLLAYAFDTALVPAQGSGSAPQSYDCSGAISEAELWVSLPMFDEALDDPWGTFERALVLPTDGKSVPKSFRAAGEGADKQVRLASSPSNAIGSYPEALASQNAWAYEVKAVGYPTCAYFPERSTDKEPLTVVSQYLALVAEKAPEDASLDEEVAEAVGYAILKGREVYAACFGVYGNLIKMASWHFKSMPSLEFDEMYARVEAGSDLFYKKDNPSKIVFRHSTFYSVTMGTAYTIYHEAMADEPASRGPESYQFLVFPCESVSLHKIEKGTLDEAWPVDAEGPDGSQYHYITMRNAVPKCPKYVDPYKWSIIDIIHELYLLIWGIGPLCGDNGDRQAKLEDALKGFGLTPPDFVGQLPNDGDGELADFKITIFDKYAAKIKQLVDDIYGLRAQILAATEAW